MKGREGETDPPPTQKGCGQGEALRLPPEGPHFLCRGVSGAADHGLRRPAIEDTAQQAQGPRNEGFCEGPLHPRALLNLSVNDLPPPLEAQERQQTGGA